MYIDIHYLITTTMKLAKVLFLSIYLLSISNKSYSQNDNAAMAGMALAGIGTAIAVIESIKEQLEYHATNHN